MINDYDTNEDTQVVLNTIMIKDYDYIIYIVIVMLFYLHAMLFNHMILLYLYVLFD